MKTLKLDGYTLMVDAILAPAFGHRVADLCGVDIVISAYYAGITPFGCAMLVALRRRLRP